MTRSKLWSQGLKISLATLALGASVSLLPGPAWGARCVNTGGTAGCYSTLQAAVDAAGAGETVTIRPGIYNQTVRIISPKVGLRLVGGGVNASQVVISGFGLGGDTINVQAYGVRIQKLTVAATTGVGIRSTAGAPGLLVSGVTVRTSNASGVLLEDSGEVRNSTFIACSTGVYASSSALNVVIRQNSFSNCNNAIYSQAPSTLVTGNAIVSGSQGIYVSNGVLGQILNNSVRDCSGNGIVASGTPKSTAVMIVKNNLVEGGNQGISATGPVLDLEKNTVRGASQKGIEFTCETATGSALRNNVVEGSQSGFVVSNTDPAVGLAISGNVARGASTVGFQIDGEDNTVEKNAASLCGMNLNGGGFNINGSGNTVRNNKAINNGWVGITIRENTVAELNTASGNAIGILLNGNLNTVQNNIARSNALYGIKVDAAAASNTVQGNVARSNIAVDFCNAGTLTSTSLNSFGTTGTSCP